MVPPAGATTYAARLATGWRARPQIIAGLCVTGFAGVAIAIAASLPMGTIALMGPGFVPIAVGVALFGCGLVIAFAKGAAACAPCAGTNRGSGLTLLALALFAVLVEPAGALVAAIVLGVVAAIAAGLSLARAALAGGAIGAGTVLVFTHGLGVPLRLLPLV